MLFSPRTISRATRISICLLWTALAAGCASWQPDWPVTAPVRSVPDVASLLAEAERSAAAADDQDSLQAAMAANRRVLDRDPHQVRALTDLANQTILMGTAYGDDRRSKHACFLSAMRLCERAMYTHPEFKALADEGAAPWEACHVLDADYVPAMMFWSTAVLYRFKEVFSFPEKVSNLSWVAHTGPFLTRMETLAPTWGGGAIQFTWSLYYGILPGAMGGDAALSRQHLDAAVAFGAPWMLSRWGRATYFHVRDGNRRGFEEDLRWVLAQDAAVPGEAYCWRAYFQRDARQALADVDRYFD
jgi:hypothetical protein